MIIPVSLRMVPYHYNINRQNQDKITPPQKQLIQKLWNNDNEAEIVMQWDFHVTHWNFILLFPGSGDMNRSSMKTDVPSVAADAVLVKSEFDSSSAQVSSD